MNRQRFLFIFLLQVLLVCFLTVDVSYSAPETAKQSDFVSDFVDKFQAKSSTWEPIIGGYAITLLKYLVILEVIFIGVKASLGRSDIAESLKQLVMLILMAGFFHALITNYQDWTKNLIKGLELIALKTQSGEYQASTPFATGLNIVGKVLSQVSGWSPFDSIVLLLSACVVIVCFALISAQVVYIQCESYVAMMAALLLVGCGGSNFTKDYALNVVKYIVSVAFKLFVMQLVLGLGMSFIEGFSGEEKITFAYLFTTIGSVIVVLALVKSLPDVVGGIINGSHIGSGNAMASAASAVGGAAMGAAIGAVNTAGSIKDAAKIASGDGKTGMAKLGSMAGSMFQARQDGKAPGEKNLSTRMRSAMAGRLEAQQNSKNKQNNSGGNA